MVLRVLTNRIRAEVMETYIRIKNAKPPLFTYGKIFFPEEQFSNFSDPVKFYSGLQRTFVYVGFTYTSIFLLLDVMTETFEGIYLSILSKRNMLVQTIYCFMKNNCFPK
jgi:hypothetical protein